MISHQIAHGFIVELSDDCRVFEFDEGIMEIVLIHGTVFSRDSLEVLEAPNIITSEYKAVSNHFEFVVYFVQKKICC